MLLTAVQKEPREDIAAVLLRTAREAEYLAQEAMQLEIAINRILEQADQSVHDGLFRADILRQSLEGLGLFLTELVETVASDSSCLPEHAVQKLPLKAQVQRLSSPHAMDNSGDMPPSGSDTELW